MATYAPVAYTTAANNTQIDFDITFTFLRNQDIAVSVIDPSGNVLVAGTGYDTQLQTQSDGTFDMRVVQAGTLTTTNTPLTAGHVISIKRATDISTILTVFQDGASFKAADINAIINQLFNNAQETAANVGEGIGLTDDLAAFDADNKPLRNLGTPTADNDAMRKIDIDSGIGPDITTVAGIASDVTSVANDATDIGVLAADISGTNTIGTVSTNIASVQNVSGAIASVNAVAGNATNINAVAGNATNINAVAADAADINTIVANIADINTVAADTADIGAVAADIQVGGPDNIGTVANAIGDVGIVAGINGQVQTVAGAIANVNTVAADTADIGTVATNIADVNTVAGISSDVTSLAPQATNISTLTQAANLTALQNAQANATAAQSALNQLNNKYHGSFTNVAGNDAEVLADIANDANLTLEAGDLYFDSTNSKLRYYDGSAWYNAAAAQVINTTSLQNVGDVNAYVGLNTDDFLKYDGTGWQNVNPTAVKGALSIAAGDVSGLSAVATSNDYDDLLNKPTLGTAAAAATTDFATTAQGTKADSALQPGIGVDDLADVDTTGLASGSLLRWDGASSFVPTSLVEDGSGNVGIGTSSPTSQLSFGATIGRDFAVYEGANGANKYGIGMSGDGSGGNPFRTKIYANGVESVSITSDGKMGIGTDTPGATLDVRGTAFIGPASTVDEYQGMSFVQGKDSSVANTVSFIDFRNNEFTADAHIFAYHNTDGSSVIAFGSTTAGSRSTDRRAERMRIDGSGNLLIGYTSSNGTAYKLQVNSQIFATSSTIATSDQRYKENVIPLTDAIDTVKALNPVQFDWKEHPVHEFDRSAPTTGFIAQEVQTALADKPWLNSLIKSNEVVIEPEQTDEDGNVIAEAVSEEFLGIAEGNLIAVLTAAIQEQQTQIEAQQATISALEARVTALEAL